MVNTFLLVILLLIVAPMSGQANDFTYQKLALKGGVVFGSGKIGALNSSIDSFAPMGLSTQFGAKLKKWEFGLTSRILLSKLEELTFQVNSQEIHGSGNMRSVDITPIMRYFFDYRFPNVKAYFLKKQKLIPDMNLSNWAPFISFGPTWSLQSIALKQYQTSGSFRNRDMLTYESFGWSLSFGLEEQLLSKSEHPVHFEIILNANKTSDVSLVDRSNTREINILSREETTQNITTFFVLFNMGMILFLNYFNF